MKTIYIECNMGAAGDMLLAALLELHPDPDSFIRRMNVLGIPGVRVERETAVKCGIAGTHVSVSVTGEEEESADVEAGHVHPAHHGDHNHDHAGHGHSRHDDHSHGARGHRRVSGHHHTGMAEIEEIIRALPVSDKVKAEALAVYGLIAEAESKAHGKAADSVHFHEVGMMDAIADIVGVCLLIEDLKPQRIVASPVHVGSGQVNCAHGILPVPVPATAYILKKVPTYGGQIKGELCTPTGAALIKYFADEFGEQPMMAVDTVGCGMGKKDFPVCNCVRAFIGESKQHDANIVEISCNLDDMTGEELGFALNLLLESGALDVYTIPIQMKKNRPGHMLVCLCKPQDEEKMSRLMLKHTTSFGVRSSSWRRRTMERSIKTVRTEYGPVRVKAGSGFGVFKSKAEYDDIALLAKEKCRSLFEIKAGLRDSAIYE